MSGRRRSLTCINALSVVSRSYCLMRPEVPGKSQRPPTGRCHSFGSVQGMRAGRGLVIVDRRSDPNERQRALLKRLAAGEEHPAAWAPVDWRSARALRERGLLRISRGGGEALVEVTEDGRYYLCHGQRPDGPMPAEGDDQAASDGPAGRRGAPCPTPNGSSLVRDEPRRSSWSSGCSPRGVSVSLAKTSSPSAGRSSTMPSGTDRNLSVNGSRRSASGQVGGRCTSQRGHIPTHGVGSRRATPRWFGFPSG